METGKKESDERKVIDNFFKDRKTICGSSEEDEPLKTLDEMTLIAGNRVLLSRQDLRAEAIQLLGKNKNHHLFEKFAYEMENNEGIDVLDAAMDSESWGPQRLAEEYMNWLLKRFFNLTEEDLK